MTDDEKKAFKAARKAIVSFQRALEDMSGRYERLENAGADFIPEHIEGAQDMFERAGVLWDEVEVYAT